MKKRRFRLRYLAASVTMALSSSVFAMGAVGVCETATGSGANASGVCSAAYASASVASGDYSSVFGYASSASGYNAVAFGAYSSAPDANTVSVGNASTNLTRRITNVAAGTDPTDAVNFSQLNAVDVKATQASSDAATALTAATGAQTTAQVADTKATTALNGVNALSTRVDSVETTANTALMTAQTADTKATAAISTANSALSSANRANERIDALEGQVGVLRRDMYRGLAEVSAMATAIPKIKPGSTSAIGVGLGSYHGESAVVIGGAVNVGESSQITFATSPMSGSMSVGFSFSF